MSAKPPPTSTIRPVRPTSACTPRISPGTIGTSHRTRDRFSGTSRDAYRAGGLTLAASWRSLCRTSMAETGGMGRIAVTGRRLFVVLACFWILGAISCSLSYQRSISRHSREGLLNESRSACHRVTAFGPVCRRVRASGYEPTVIFVSVLAAALQCFFSQAFPLILYSPTPIFPPPSVFVKPISIVCSFHLALIASPHVINLPTRS